MRQTQKQDPRTPDVNRHIGARIRERRVALGWTQRELAGLIGVTYQQVHKYESADTRLSVAGLFEVARALQMPVGYFIDGLEGKGRVPRDDPATLLQDRMFLELARNFSQIANERHQEALSQIARALAMPHEGPLANA